ISDDCDDGIGSVVDTLDMNPRRGTGCRRIVARPFAKRSFGSGLYVRRRHLAFQNNFRVRRNRQPGMLTGNDLKRLAGNMAGKIILRNAPWESQRCRRKKNWLDSADDRDGTGLLLRPILL